MGLISEKLRIAFVWGLLVFSFMKSSVLTFMHAFSFFLVFKLYKSDLHIIYFIADHIKFLGIVGVGGYLVVGYLEKWVLSLGQFSDVFFFGTVNCISYHILDVDNVPFEEF